MRRSVENAEKLFVYSERRLGKTSLIRKVLAELPEQEYLTVYIDLWPTDGETSFVLSCAKAFTEAMATNTDKLLHIAKTFFGRLVPSITSNDEGRAVISFGFDQKRPDMPLLEEVLAMPAKAAEKSGLSWSSTNSSRSSSTRATQWSACCEARFNTRPMWPIYSAGAANI